MCAEFLSASTWRLKQTTLSAISCTVSLSVLWMDGWVVSRGPPRCFEWGRRWEAWGVSLNGKVKLIWRLSPCDMAMSLCCHIVDFAVCIMQLRGCIKSFCQRFPGVQVGFAFWRWGWGWGCLCYLFSTADLNRKVKCQGHWRAGFETVYPSPFPPVCAITEKVGGGSWREVD